MKAIVVHPNRPTTDEGLENLRKQIDGLLAEQGFDDEDLTVTIKEVQ